MHFGMGRWPTLYQQKRVAKLANCFGVGAWLRFRSHRAQVNAHRIFCSAVELKEFLQTFQTLNLSMLFSCHEEHGITPSYLKNTPKVF